MALEPELAARPVCDLETIGRASGLPRRIEIWFAADPLLDRVYMLSGGRDAAHWVRNLQRDGRVRVRIGERWFGGTAAVIEAGPDDGLARRLLAAKYEGWTDGASLTGWARASLLVAIDLRPATG